MLMNINEADVKKYTDVIGPLVLTIFIVKLSMGDIYLALELICA